jgi:type IV pilus assembly protein PilY1
VQPITAAPEVMLDCVMNAEGRGLMVIFGTGQYLNVDDFDDSRVQSFYGIWDWGDIWEAKEGFNVAKTKYLGSVNPDRSLSTDAGVTLLEQTFVSNALDWSILSDDQPVWYNPFDDTGQHMGWMFDLPDPGERAIREPLLRMGTAVLVSTIPSNSPCDAGGSSVLYQVKACSGGRTDTPQFDVNADGSVTYYDTIMIGGVAYPPSGKKFDRILFEPIEITDKLYLSDSEGGINALDVPPNRPGMFFWRVVGQ